MAWTWVTTVSRVDAGVTVTGRHAGDMVGNLGSVAGLIVDPDPSIVLARGTVFLANYGTIVANDPILDGSGGLAYGIFGYSGDADLEVANRDTGIIRVSAPHQRGEAIGYYVDSFSGPSFTNAGLIEVSSNGDASGIASWALKGRYANSGTIRVTAGDFARGVYLPNSSSRNTFQNSGLIEVHGDGTPFGVSLGGYNNTFYNWYGGIIRVVDSAGRGVGVSIQSNDGDAGPHHNDGLIEADTALMFVNKSDYDILRFTNEERGVMRGDVVSGPNSEHIENFGEIYGNISLGDGADGYFGSSGLTTGLVSGEGGNDSLQGGAHFDYLQGNTGDDTISGGGGGDWVVGGKDNDLLYGGGDADVVWGNIGNDTQHGDDGNDQVRGGQGDDFDRWRRGRRLRLRRPGQ